MLRGAIETYQEVASLPNVPTDLLKLTLKRRSDRQQFLGKMEKELVQQQMPCCVLLEELSYLGDRGGT